MIIIRYCPVEDPSFAVTTLVITGNFSIREFFSDREEGDIKYRDCRARIIKHGESLQNSEVVEIPYCLSEHLMRAKGDPIIVDFTKHDRMPVFNTDGDVLAFACKDTAYTLPKIVKWAEQGRVKISPSLAHSLIGRVTLKLRQGLTEEERDDVAAAITRLVAFLVPAHKWDKTRMAALHLAGEFQ